MSTAPHTGPAQPDAIDQAEDERTPAPAKDKACKDSEKPAGDDLPGADGPSQASATEDTYD